MSSPPTRSGLRILVDTTLVALLVSGILSAILALLGGDGLQLVRFGLLVPPLFVVALGVGAGLSGLGRATENLDWTAALGRRAPELLLAGPVMLLVWWILGVGGLRVLASWGGHASSGGVVLGVLAVVVVTSGSWLIEHGARRLLPRAIALRTALVVLLLSVVGGVATSVVIGSTSGTGSAWALFGVFKRPELDLSGVVTLAGCALACFSAGFLVRARSYAALRSTCVVAVLVMLGGVLRTAQVDYKAAAAIEREGGLAATSLRVLQRLTDRDGDGSAVWFGGEDCDDGNPAVHPAAIENYDTAQDDNCDGLTARPAPPASATSPEAATNTRSPATGPAALRQDLNVLLLTVDTLRAELGYSALPGTRPGISP
ncbi:MAG TPA: putative metal-binding motif-containing protein, partial [Polyangiaceae bacterium]|nr:putative metal-binding motif-containing protein [Polyangiaceae bacterium]